MERKSVRDDVRSRSEPIEAVMVRPVAGSLPRARRTDRNLSASATVTFDGSVVLGMEACGALEQEQRVWEEGVGRMEDGIEASEILREWGCLFLPSSFSLLLWASAPSRRAAHTVRSAHSRRRIGKPVVDPSRSARLSEFVAISRVSAPSHSG